MPNSHYLRTIASLALTSAVSSAEPFPQTTAAPTGKAACQDVAQSLSICDSLTPGVTSSAFLLQAPCLCYDARFEYDPQLFDAPFSNCLGYYSTADPSLYASISDEGPIVSQPCSSIGDVVGSLGSEGSFTRTPTGSIPLTSSSAPATTSSPTLTTSSGTTTLQPLTTSSPAEANKLATVGLGLGGLVIALAGYLRI